jgi:hypothetical protein
MSEPNTPLEMDETKAFLSNPVAVEDKTAISNEEDDVLDRYFGTQMTNRSLLANQK